MAITATVSSIGPKAINPKDPVLVLFDTTATEDLQQIAIIQTFTSSVEHLALEKGSTISIDDQVYTVAFAGALVAANLTSIGHATLYFTEVPAKPMENGIYLTPTALPSVHEGSTISYQP